MTKYKYKDMYVCKHEHIYLPLNTITKDRCHKTRIQWHFRGIKKKYSREKTSELDLNGAVRLDCQIRVKERFILKEPCMNYEASEPEIMSGNRVMSWSPGTVSFLRMSSSLRH